MLSTSITWFSALTQPRQAGLQVARLLQVKMKGTSKFYSQTAIGRQLASTVEHGLRMYARLIKFQVLTRRRRGREGGIGSNVTGQTGVSRKTCRIPLR